MGNFKFSLGGSASYISFNYEGNIKNGKVAESGSKYPTNNFVNYSGKAGAAYKLTKSSDVEFNAMYAKRAPLIMNSYLSPRISGDILSNLQNETVMAGEVNYFSSSALMDLRVSGYFTLLKDQSIVRSFYDNNYASYLNLGMSGLNTRYVGAEASAIFNITKEIKADLAIAYGMNKYVSDPEFILMQENTNETLLQGITGIKDFFLGGAPQMAISAGGIYESDKNWWAGLNVSYTDKNYKDINPVAFAMIFSTLDEMQDKLKSNLSVNLNTGYSYKFGIKAKKALTLNVNVQNLLGTKSGIMGAYNPFGIDNNIHGNRYAYMYGRTFYLMLGFTF